MRTKEKVGFYNSGLRIRRSLWIWRTSARSTLVNQNGGWFSRRHHRFHRAQHTQYSARLLHYHLLHTNTHIAASFLATGNIIFFLPPRKQEQVGASLHCEKSLVFFEDSSAPSREESGMARSERWSRELRWTRVIPCSCPPSTILEEV